MKKTNSSLTVNSDWNKDTFLADVKKVYGKDLQDHEFSLLCQLGMATNLNPFLREIWAVKYGNAPATIFIGRDGYRKAAQNYNNYDYHIVDSVYSNDDFRIENSKIIHNYNITDRGKLVGAYCSVKRKSSSKPMFVYVDLNEYNLKKSVWLTKPATMIKKVAEAQGLRMAFQSIFAGTYDESEDWTVEEINSKQEPIKQPSNKKSKEVSQKPIKEEMPHDDWSTKTTQAEFIEIYNEYTIKMKWSPDQIKENYEKITKGKNLNEFTETQLKAYIEQFKNKLNQ